MDYVEWHLVLNSIRPLGRDPHAGRVELDDGDAVTPAIFPPTRTPAQWHAHAQHTEVQAVTAHLDLRTAQETWAPSRRAAHTPQTLGFDDARIRVRRLRVAGA